MGWYQDTATNARSNSATNIWRYAYTTSNTGSYATTNNCQDTKTNIGSYAETIHCSRSTSNYDENAKTNAIIDAKANQRAKDAKANGYQTAKDSSSNSMAATKDDE